MKTKDIILRILQKKSPLTTYHLIKLTYLVDLAFVQLTGKIKTNLPYSWWHFGPYCKEFDKTVWELEENKNIAINAYTTAKHHDCRLHSPINKKPPKLNELEENVISYIIKKYSKLNKDELEKIVYSTPPMKEAIKKNNRFKKLNMNCRSNIIDSLFDKETVEMILNSENIEKVKLISSNDAIRILENKLIEAGL